MSEAEQPEIDVPPELLGGVWANYVNAYGDVEEITLDFARLDPRDTREGVVVARVTASLRRWREHRDKELARRLRELRGRD